MKQAFPNWWEGGILMHQITPKKGPNDPAPELLRHTRFHAGGQRLLAISIRRAVGPASRGRLYGYWLIRRPRGLGTAAFRAYRDRGSRRGRPGSGRPDQRARGSDYAPRDRRHRFHVAAGVRAYSGLRGGMGTRDRRFLERSQ